MVLRISQRVSRYECSTCPVKFTEERIMEVLRITATILAVTVAGVLARPEPPVFRDQYLPPNQQYGPPTGVSQVDNSYTQRPNQQYLPSNQQYGAPSQFGYGQQGYNDESAGPAKYEFEYTVNDAASGNDFGHRESRDGDLTRGTYFVLLPDGRRQTVEYEADTYGYRPKITYVDEQQGGYGGGSGNNGYRY